VPALASPVLEDVLTGATVAAPDGRLGLARAFAAFPGALLVGRTRGR
jgi:hypothetical protein